MKLAIFILLQVTGWTLTAGSLTTDYQFGLMPAVLFLSSIIIVAIPKEALQYFTGVSSK